MKSIYRKPDARRVVTVSIVLLSLLGFASCASEEPVLPVADTILVEGVERTEYDLRNLQLDVDGVVWGSRGRDLYRITPGGASVLKMYSFDGKINAVHFFASDSLLVATDDDHFDPHKPAQIFLSTDYARSFESVHEIQGGSALFWSIASDQQQRLFVGEYGPQQPDMSKTVWMSENAGQDWRRLFVAPNRAGVHIHRVAVDPVTQDLWISIGDGEENRAVMRARTDSIDNFEWIADSQATAIEFTKTEVYLGEDRRRKAGVTAINRLSGKASAAIRFAEHGNYGGSVYDLALGAHGAIYAPTMKYPDQNHVAALWAGSGRQWMPILLFNSQTDKGGGRETIAGPDSRGFLYVTGYRINDAEIADAISLSNPK